jgi:putative redox protein
MGLTATARWIPGTLRQDVLVDGRHRLTTDEPIRVGGEGSAPAPHELFPAALAACASTTLVKYAQTKDWDLGDVTVAVQYDHRSTPRRFELEIELTGEVTDEQLVRLRKVVASCPVRRAVESGFEFSERFKLTDGSDCEIASLEGHDRKAGRGERDQHEEGDVIQREPLTQRVGCDVVIEGRHRPRGFEERHDGRQ